jgi:metal-responsive CopG/Arc/MetJ family transcriptional regulator
MTTMKTKLIKMQTRLMPDTVKRIEKIISKKNSGYSSRSEFIRIAVNKLIRDHDKLIKEHEV